MKKIFYLISPLILIILTNTIVFSQNNSQSEPEITAKLKKSIEKSLRYEYPSDDEIEPYGSKIIPYLKPYLNDSELRVRLLALNLLIEFKDPETLPFLLPAVSDPDSSMSRIAAQHLYDNFDHQTLAQNAAVGEALRQGAAKGHHSISLIILLGYFPGTDTEKALLSIRDKDDLRYWTNNREIFFDAEIFSNVPVYLSLNRIDNQKYSAPFGDLIKKASSGEIEFLLFTLNYIDDKILLKQIFDKGIVNRKILASEYGIEGGLMANPMRMMDLTVNRFADKLKLNLGFKTQERYTPSKINIARQKITAQINSL